MANYCYFLKCCCIVICQKDNHMIRNILKEERNYKKIREKNKLTNQPVTST
jgi:hypothetical protein